MSSSEYRDYTALRVEAINRAPRGIPEDRVRLHFCWCCANAQCYAFEASNPRHEREWRVFETLYAGSRRRVAAHAV
jgi:5-methyltetrahydropteroyltriglutamate--homocysteine methyltransferase